MSCENCNNGKKKGKNGICKNCPEFYGGNPPHKIIEIKNQLLNNSSNADENHFEGGEWQ